MGHPSVAANGAFGSTMNLGDGDIERSGLIGKVGSPEFWGMLASIVAILVFFWGASVWIIKKIDASVDQRVDARMAPHLSLLSAQMFENFSEYSAALDALWEVSDGCNKLTTGSEAISLLAIQECLGEDEASLFSDVLMSTVVHAPQSKFIENSVFFRDVVEQLGNRAADSAWRMEILGMFHLRNLDVEKSLEILERSILTYKGQLDHRRSAWPHWYRVLVLTYVGHTESAAYELNQAVSCAPRDFGPFLYEGEELAIDDENILAGLNLMNPTFGDSMKIVIEKSRGLERLDCRETATRSYSLPN